MEDVKKKRKGCMWLQRAGEGGGSERGDYAVGRHLGRRKITRLSNQGRWNYVLCYANRVGRRSRWCMDERQVIVDIQDAAYVGFHFRFIPYA
jgi:hypothetical protein